MDMGNDSIQATAWPSCVKVEPNEIHLVKHINADYSVALKITNSCPSGIYYVSSIKENPDVPWINPITLPPDTELKPGDSISVNIRGTTPQATGEVSTSLKITLVGLITKEIPISIEVIEPPPPSDPPKLQVSPTVIDLGKAYSGTHFEKISVLTIKNIGGGALTGYLRPSKAWLETQPGDFGLAKGAEAYISVSGNFPSTVGPFPNDTEIAVISNGGGKDISILGSVLGLSIAPPEIDLGVGIAGTEFQRSFQVQNKSDRELTIEISREADWIRVIAPFAFTLSVNATKVVNLIGYYPESLDPFEQTININAGITSEKVEVFGELKEPGFSTCYISGKITIDAEEEYARGKVNVQLIRLIDGTVIDIETTYTGTYSAKITEDKFGTYRVEPTKKGYKFTPESITVNTDDIYVSSKDFSSRIVGDLQPNLRAPWIGKAEVTQGNKGGYSHNACHKRSMDQDDCTWENVYALDIVMKDENDNTIDDDIPAPTDGFISYLDNSTSGGGGRELALMATDEGGKATGYELVFLHLSDLTTATNNPDLRKDYADYIKGEKKLEEIKRIKQGEIIAKSGASADGSDSGSAHHLHFHIWDGVSSRDASTMPIANLWMIKDGEQEDPRFYESKGDGDDHGFKGSLLDVDIEYQYFWSDQGFHDVFSDVPQDYWAKEWVEKVYEKGIMTESGLYPLRFSPEEPVTRASVCLFLLKTKYGKDYQPPPATGTVFNDVPKDHPFASWIEKSKADGFTSGCSTTPPLYCPDQPLTRAEAAVFLVRLVHGTVYTPPPATGKVFQDVPATLWSAKWIEQLYKDGIASGCSANPPLYCPDDPLKRAEMAVFLVKTIERRTGCGLGSVALAKVVYEAFRQLRKTHSQ